ncbi:MAG: hypothetical protein NC453_12170 [Muribaculum sp.]|nr:hypothetical protein [Muribaculum sp.]
MKLQSIFAKTTRISFGEIKYFHPTGRTTLPNGHPLQKGAFLNECRINRDAFTLPDGRSWDYVLVFPTGVSETSITEAFIKNEPHVYAIGKFFIGSFIINNSATFNEKSVSVAISDRSHSQLSTLTHQILHVCVDKTILIKAFPHNKIYLAK